MSHDRFSQSSWASIVPMGEGAMLLPEGLLATPPSMVACMVLPSMAFAMLGIYQLAYENALAATRVTRFEFASKACLN